MRLIAAALICLSFLSVQVYAVPVGFTDEVAFNNALAAASLVPTTLNFDSITAGTTFTDPSTIGQFNFSNLGPSPNTLLIDDQFATTSGSNYLGTPNPAFANQFIAGHTMDLSFPASNAISLKILTSDIPGISLFTNDIQLNAGGGNVGIDQTGGTIIPPTAGDREFFLGIIDTTTIFTTASLDYEPAAVGFVVFNIDDMTTAAVPEPNAAMLLVLVGLFGGGREYVRKRQSFRSTIDP